MPLPMQLEGPFAIATHGLVKRYGSHTVLRGVDLQVPEGSVCVMIGPNGAGKTTLLGILLDLVRAADGRAELLGMDPRTDGSRVRAQIGYVPERFDWGPGRMKVGRLLEHHATFYPAWDREYAARLTRAFALPLDRPVGQLSKGERRRVQHTMALAHRPPVLLLDEPLDGLDPVMRDETIGMLAEHIADVPTTALVCTHVVHDAERIADHVVLLRAGRLMLQARRETMHGLLRRYRAEVPDDWSGVPDLNGMVAQRLGLGREIHWTIWGDEREVAATLTRAGARIREIATLSLEDAALALLATRDPS